MELFIVVAVAGTLIVIAIGAYILQEKRYYGRMFAENNFREFHECLSRAIEKAKAQSPNQEPVFDDETAFVTHAGLGVTVTLDPVDDRFVLHVAISQPGRHTTHAVCLRFGFFALAMLWDNKAELNPYFTESRIHHMNFTFQSQDITLQDFDNSYSRYLQEYRPIPFRHEKLGSEPDAAADAGTPRR